MDRDGATAATGTKGLDTGGGREGPRRGLFLEFQYQGGAIRVACHEGSGERPATLRRYEDSPVSLDHAERHAARIKDLLGRANRRGRIGNDLLASLEQAGQLLYQELFPPRARQALVGTAVEHLVLATDDRLVHIPWELAHDGDEFLCRRFSMGRVVSTRQEFVASRRRLQRPLSMLIVADPQGNLPSAYEEGLQLRDLLDPTTDRAAVTLKSTHVGRDYLRSRLRDHDILHYAGHADYDPLDPAESGFLLADGKLSARELRDMIGRRPFPALVFSNACDSGHTQQWQAAEGYETVFGLANAFLLAGVRHYLGAFWEVPDEPSLCFARAFYQQLVCGATVGTAVRDARRAIAAEYGEDTVFWASYMLYGDPTVKYVGAEMSLPHEPAERTGAGAIEVGELRGAPLRSGAPVFRPSTKTALVAAGLAVAAVVGLFSLGGWPPRQAPTVMVAANGSDPARDLARAKALDGRIAELADRYRRGETPQPPKRDDWISAPLSVVFLGVEANGPSASERDFLLNSWSAELGALPRITVVERQLLDDLLRELELGASDLTDPAAVLKLGHVLAANLIITGSVSRQNDQWLVSLRVIETESTAVKASVSALQRQVDLRAVAETAGAKLRTQLRRGFPLQARVTSVDGNEVTVNVGATLGVTQGLRLQLLSTGGEPAGELEVVAAETSRCRARVLGEGTPSQGQRVRELLPADGS